MLHFNEDTRVKFPATIQFMRLGYEYQSLKKAQVDFNTKIFVNRFKPALEKINNIALSDDEVFDLIDEIHSLRGASARHVARPICRSAHCR